MLVMRKAGVRLGWPILRRGPPYQLLQARAYSMQEDMRVYSNYIDGRLYRDFNGRLYRDKERAFEAVYMMRRDTELKELLRMDMKKLEDLKRDCEAIKEHVEAYQLLHEHLNDRNDILRYVDLRVPEWMGVHQIAHAQL